MSIRVRIDKLERALKLESAGPEMVAHLTRLYAAAGLEEGEETALEFVRRCREKGLEPSIMSLAKLVEEPEQ